MIRDSLEVLMAIIVLISFCVVSYEIGASMVATDCAMLGKFRHGGKVYECQVKESAP